MQITEIVGQNTNPVTLHIIRGNSMLLYDRH